MATTRRSVREYLDTLDEAVWGAASEVRPKFVSRSDPAAQWTARTRGTPSSLTPRTIDLDHAVILDVEPSRAIRQAEVGATRTMIERVQDRFGLYRSDWLPTAPTVQQKTLLGWSRSAGSAAHRRSIHEAARDIARDLSLTDAYLTSRRERKKVQMLFAHLKRILRLDRLRLRGPNGARDEFLLAATAQNLRKMAKLIPMTAPATAR